MLMIKKLTRKVAYFLVWNSSSRYTDAIVNVVTSSVAVINAIHSWFSRKRQPEKTKKKNVIITEFIDNIYPFLIGSNHLKNSS